MTSDKGELEEEMEAISDICRQTPRNDIRRIKLRNAIILMQETYRNLTGEYYEINSKRERQE